MINKLSPEAISQAISHVNSAWELRDDIIARTFQFDDFIQAFSFMTAVAILAEKLNHHPNWQNVYNQVTIALSTHDVGGLTHLDFELASQIDLLVP